MIKEVEIGERFQIDKFEIIFKWSGRKRKSNYLSDIASLTLYPTTKNLRLIPKSVFIQTRDVITSEVALKQKVTKDLYAVLVNLGKMKIVLKGKHGFCAFILNRS